MQRHCCSAKFFPFYSHSFGLYPRHEEAKTKVACQRYLGVVLWRWTVPRRCAGFLEWVLLNQQDFKFGGKMRLHKNRSSSDSRHARLQQSQSQDRRHQYWIGGHRLLPLDSQDTAKSRAAFLLHHSFSFQTKSLPQARPWIPRHVATSNILACSIANGIAREQGRKSSCYARVNWASISGSASLSSCLVLKERNSLDFAWVCSRR